jgi:hypothetical protein
MIHHSLAKRIAPGILALGLLLLAGRFWQISQMQFQDGMVQSIEPYLGECRLKVGRMIPCERYRATVIFTPPGKISPISTVIEAGEKDRHLNVRDSVKVMYESSSPERAELATIAKGWTIPLTVFVIGVLGTLVQFGFAKRT